MAAKRVSHFTLSSVLLALAAIALLAGGVVTRRARLTEERSMLAVAGTVESIYSVCRPTSRSGGGRGRDVCSYFPSVRFYAGSERPLHFTSRTGNSFRPLLEGQSVTVLYSPRDPVRSARVRGYGLAAETPYFGLGSLIALAGIASHLYRRGTRPNNSSKPTPLRGAA